MNAPLGWRTAIQSEFAQTPTGVSLAHAQKEQLVTESFVIVSPEKL